MTKQQVEVEVDVREPTGLIEAVTNHDEVAEVHLTELNSADLKIEGVGFERKTPSDFASSMTEDDNRLRDQVARMAQDYKAAYVLIEGGLQDLSYLQHTNVPETALRGFAASIEARQNVPVKFCDTQDLLVDMAVRLSRKHIEEPSREMQLNSAIERDAPLGKRMWGCVEGLGATRAEAVYEAVGDPIHFSTECQGEDVAPIETLQAISGIGEKTARDIIQQLWADTTEPDDLTESEDNNDN